jgi:hypothetical protein
MITQHKSRNRDRTTVQGKASFVLAGILLLGSTVYAGVDETVLKLETTGQQETVIRINSEEHGFSLQDLQPGESRSLQSEDGRPVTVTKVDSGVQFNIDGEVVDMPMPGDAGGEKVIRKRMYRDGNHDAKVVTDIEVEHMDIAGGATIASEQALDQATQDAIRAALANAGIDEVHFLNAGDAEKEVTTMRRDGDQEIRVIRKEVRVTN